MPRVKLKHTNRILDPYREGHTKGYDEGYEQGLSRSEDYITSLSDDLEYEQNYSSNLALKLKEEKEQKSLNTYTIHRLRSTFTHYCNTNGGFEELGEAMDCVVELQNILGLYQEEKT